MTALPPRTDVGQGIQVNTWLSVYEYTPSMQATNQPPALNLDAPRLPDMRLIQLPEVEATPPPEVEATPPPFNLPPPTGLDGKC